MAKLYPGGIRIPTNLQIQNPNPVADYMVVSAKTDLTNTTILPYQFTGMTTFVVEDQNTYVLKNTGWEILGSGSSFTGGTVSGATRFTGGLTANTISSTTISATNYIGLSDIYVPYTGATKNVDLNTYSINADGGFSSNWSPGFFNGGTQYGGTNSRQFNFFDVSDGSEFAEGLRVNMVANVEEGIYYEYSNPNTQNGSGINLTTENVSLSTQSSSITNLVTISTDSLNSTKKITTDVGFSGPSLTADTSIVLQDVINTGDYSKIFYEEGNFIFYDVTNNIGKFNVNGFEFTMNNPNGNNSIISNGLITNQRTYYLPDADGTFALLTDITSFSGGTVTGLTVNGILTVTGNTSLRALTATSISVTGNTSLRALTATTISATTYNGYVPLSATPITVVNTSSLFSTGLSNTGLNASGVTSSIFLGVDAGRTASAATQSNFFGQSAGDSATNAGGSNFFGLTAGRAATGASGSNFFSESAGQNARNASGSNFFGGSAGRDAFNASSSNFFGSAAGRDAVNASGSNFFGNQVGYGASGATNSNFIGTFAGYGATGASYSNFMGYNAGRSSDIGSNNIIIGTNISLPSGTTNSLNIGGVLFGTGTYSTTGGSASISGQTNGRIGIGVVSPTQTLHVSGNTLVEGTLTVSGTTAAIGGSNAGSLLDLQQTWNTSGTPTAVKLNVTDIASAASNSLLMDLQVTGSSKFSVAKDGSVSAANGFRQNVYQVSSSNSGLTLRFGGVGTGTTFGAQIENSGSSNIYTAPSGTFNYFQLQSTTFQPTTGNGVFNGYFFGSTINQTGGASGITRGLFVNPILTSAADFRAIETTNGMVVFSDTYEASGTTSGSLLDLRQTWDTSGTPTAIKLNVTDTASNINSLLMDLQVTGSSKFSVNKNGGISATTISATTYQNLPSTPFLPLSGGTVTGPVIIKDDTTPLTITTSNYVGGSQGNILYFTDITGTTNGKAINSRSNGGASSGDLILQQQGNGFVGVNTSSVNPTLNYNLDVNGSFGATSVSATTISATTYNGYEPADMRTDLTNRRLGYTVSTDFLSTFTAALAPYSFSSSASGTLQIIGSQIDNHHPGVQQIAAATGLTNSGGSILSHAATNAFSVVFTDGLQTDLIFKLPPTTTNNVIRIGFTYGSLTITAPTSGNYFEITGSTLVGITRNSNVQSQSSSFALTASTWYHSRVKETIVGTANTVTFTVYDMSGVTLYNQSSTTNINTTTTRGVNVICLNTVSNAAITSIIYLDYLGVTFPPMVRGALD